MYHIHPILVLRLTLDASVMYHACMTTSTRPIRANQTQLGERSMYSIRVLPEERRQMQAIAAYRHWPEAEAWRDAVRFYLREQEGLLRIIGDTASQNGHNHSD